MATEDDITSATELIVKEATEEANLKRLSQKRFIRVIVDDDVARNRFKAPLGNDNRLAKVDTCYQEESEAAERRLAYANTSVEEAKTALINWRDWKAGKKTKKGIKNS